jgi:hypothetical protein
VYDTFLLEWACRTGWWNAYMFEDIGHLVNEEVEKIGADLCPNDIRMEWRRVAIVLTLTPLLTGFEGEALQHSSRWIVGIKVYILCCVLDRPWS